MTNRLFVCSLLLLLCTTVRAASVAIVSDGKARATIFVAPEVMAADAELNAGAGYDVKENETQRRRLRDSVKDFVATIEKVSGATLSITEREPKPGDKGLPILVGDYAVHRFGAVQGKTDFGQTWRLVVSKRGIGLLGENGESTSYAIYEVLDRLGCRWFMPGEMGEVLPKTSTVTLAETDVTSAPSTLGRVLTYSDADFNRRNRQTAQRVSALHALEFYITDEQRKQHPEWRAIINGKPDAVRLKWSNPEVANAIADAIIAKLDKSYVPTVSLSPDDGASFDESDDRKLDAGDWDPSMGQVSITDRYIVLCNRIAERVTKKYPDVKFGFLAYVQYTRPPVREKLHPNLVPEIAPITYCRAHAMTDTALCPSRPQLRAILEGWGKAAKQVAYYNYMFHLAEVAVPYPMMHQMKAELPLILNSHVAFWQPETMPAFESVLPGMWLSLRLTWDKNQNADAILNDFFTRFYGSASKPMTAYWQLFDDAWTNVPAHAGSLWEYERRFPPKFLAEARALIDEALKAAHTPQEYQRVKMQERAFRQFERWMQMRTDLNEGRLAKLDLQSTEWLGTQVGLGEEYAGELSFSKTYWTPYTIGGAYFKWFAEATYDDAALMARDYTVVSAPLRQWKYRHTDKIAGQDAGSSDSVKPGEEAGWQSVDFDDSKWKTTDSGTETWSDLGLLDAYGTLWYRQKVSVPAIAAGKKTFLWLAATDGSAKVYVNGQPVPYIDSKGETKDRATDYAKPLKFDVTAALRPGGENLICIAGTRLEFNELGTGGLLGPAYLFSEK